MTTKLMRVMWVFVSCVAACGPLASRVDAADTEKGHAIAGAGAGGVPPCSACHGNHGEGQQASGIPRLAGLDAAYLQGQLVAFGNGMRANAMMTPIAKTMDAASMADAAAYYASLTAPPTSPAKVTSAKPTPQIVVGEGIALHGDWAVNVPPCASCHGKQGLGVGAAFPPIAGQSVAYITNQLNAWRSGTRHDDPLGLMKSVAERLSDSQVADVAAYYETLPAAPAPMQTDKGGMP